MGNGESGGWDMLFGKSAIQQPCYYGKISTFIVGGNNDSILVGLRRHIGAGFRLQWMLQINKG